jgi:ribosomal protein L31
MVQNLQDNLPIFTLLYFNYQMAKEKAQHPELKEVQVLDIHGYEFTVWSTTEGPIKVESSHLSHPVYNPDKVQKKVSLGRSQLMAEKMAKMQSMNKSS